MIIRDLPTYIEKAKALIADLDTATPQVEIEARIVVTNRNFTRDLGIQWGFGARGDAALRQHHEPRLPELDRRQRQAPCRATSASRADQLGPGGLSSDAGIGAAGRGYAVNLPASSASTPRIGISMGNILGSFNLDVALTALERQGRGPAPLDAEGDDPEQPVGRDQAGRADPDPDRSPTTRSRVQFKDAVLTLQGHAADHRRGHRHPDLEVENNAPDFANRVNGIPPINTQSGEDDRAREGRADRGGRRHLPEHGDRQRQNRTPFLGNDPVARATSSREGHRHAEQRAAALHHAAHREVLEGEKSHGVPNAQIVNAGGGR